MSALCERCVRFSDADLRSLTVSTRHVAGPLVTTGDGTLLSPAPLVAALEGRPAIYRLFRALVQVYPETSTYGDLYGVGRWGTVDQADIRACNMGAWRLRHMLEPYGIDVVNLPGTGYRLVLPDADADMEVGRASDSEAVGRPAHPCDRACEGCNA